MLIQGIFHRVLPLALCVAGSLSAFAEEQAINILDTSSSGKTIRLNVGNNAGLNLNEPILLESNGSKLAAARIIRVDGDSAVAYIVDDYSGGQKLAAGNYSMIYGEPMEDVPSLPDYVADRESEQDNPKNEKFFTPEGKELDNSPELDDENYTPETVIRPKFPESRTYSANNITVGIGLFRNHAVDNTFNGTGNPGYTTYQGYAFRYAYTFRTSYWLKEKNPALISVEAAMGIYSFPFTLSNGSTLGASEEVRVIPLALEIRYLLEVSHFFRIYPYVGYQTNIVGATNGIYSSQIQPLRGGRILAGAGGQLVLSDTLDGRLEGGTDGVLFGLVVKF